MAKIALTEWAKRNGIKEDTARHKAQNGSLKTAEKIGRDWMIDEDEISVDRRKKAFNRNYPADAVDRSQQFGRLYAWMHYVESKATGDRFVTTVTQMMDYWVQYPELFRNKIKDMMKKKMIDKKNPALWNEFLEEEAAIMEIIHRSDEDIDERLDPLYLMAYQLQLASFDDYDN